MNKETINTIGKWLLAFILVGASIFFASKGNKDFAVGFGLGAGIFIFYGFVMDAF